MLPEDVTPAPPLISVVIPTRHRNGTLAECLARLAPGAQTVTASYEVIVTDDGAKSTAEQMICEQFPWARWSAGPRRGPAANRNNGAVQANGVWIAFTDDDCLPEPQWLEEFAAAAEASPELNVFEGRTLAIGDIVSPLDWAPVNETGGWLWSCNMMLKKETFASIGGFDVNFPHAHLEDVDFRERLKAAGQEFKFIPAATIGHPVRRTGLSERLGPQWECDFYYWYKQRKRGPAWPHLFVYLLKCRVQRVIAMRPGADALIVAAITAREIAYFSRHATAWENKYGRNSTPAQDPTAG